ncbi:hypothetical protein J2Y74_003201 [Pseudomonas migulae]|uniref:hypothetical protein n=1 Tax=Pseudomonas migulae TaxID=78543 RepID=UPI00209F8F32|nr:hypothetical protein [Pseudomonas migulae]MCP1518891.1 hypothetical protein [Pseudomonas migulae]
MEKSISSVLRMWPYSAGKSEIFVNSLLSSIGTYPALENVSPLGGRDGGRDLQSDDGYFRVACYFPVKEFKPYSDIELKFLGDMSKAAKGGAKHFTFVTGQILQLSEKKSLISRSSVPKTVIYDCTDILSLVSAPDAGFLRAELGFSEKIKSHDDEFFSELYRQVSFRKLINLFNDSIAPKLFPNGFFEIFDGLDYFNQTAQPKLLSRQFKIVFDAWEDSVGEFRNDLLYRDQFESTPDSRRLRLKQMDYVQFERVSKEVNLSFDSMVENTLSLARTAEEKLKLAIN